MSASNTAFIDFPFISLLTIADKVSNIGSPNTIIGNTITKAVAVFAIPNIDTIYNVYPIKFVPMSPIKVFAGLKLNGKKPDKDPTNAVIIIIAISGDPFNANIISNDMHEIIDIPVDKPSNPSIKFIAFVIPTIHIIVSPIDNALLNMIFPSKNGRSKLSILIPTCNNY